MRTITLKIPDMTAEQALAAWELVTALTDALWEAYDAGIVPILQREAESDALHEELPELPMPDFPEGR